jgi:mannobiose 2-epimerase
MAINPLMYIPEPAAQFLAEVHAIGDWWLAYAVDHDRGGFWGEVARDNTPNKKADKCIILNTRILWFFSAATRFTSREDYAAAAQRAFDYLLEYFVDAEHGGVVWMLDAQGGRVDDRKHSYAQAFAIYALSAYYQCSGDSRALDLALQLFDLLEQYAKDPDNGGYFEAYSPDWGLLADTRLSEKDDNSPKTMNTHLHILEAYTALFQAAEGHSPQAPLVEAALLEVLGLFCERIVDLQSGHVRMFLSEDWEDCSQSYSFGHDIEASWLICKAIDALSGKSYLVREYWLHAERLAEVALREGVLADGRLAEEMDLMRGTSILSAWWVQAEAMVGFANMWAMGNGEHYKEAALRIWDRVQKLHLDKEYGEWFWFAKTDVPPQGTYKIGAWKAPYHNGRAMMMLSAFFA